MTAIESYLARPVVAMTLIDGFAEVRRTRERVPAPIPPVRFQLTQREDGGVMKKIDPPIVLAPKVAPSGAYIFVDEQRAGGCRYRVAPGHYTMRIESEYYQPMTLETEWPLPSRPHRTLSLLPGSAYPFPDVTLSSTRLTLLRGAIVKEVFGLPMADVRVEMIAPPDMGDFAVCTTDARGSWVLALLNVPSQDFMATLRFTQPEGGAVVDVTNVRVLRGQDNTLSNTALRGVVLSADGTRPISKAEITIDGQPGSVFTDRDGRWIFYLSLFEPSGNASVNATLPNGASVAQDTPIHNRATVVVPPFRIG